MRPFGATLMRGSNVQQPQWAPGSTSLTRTGSLQVRPLSVERMNFTAAAGALAGRSPLTGGVVVVVAPPPPGSDETGANGWPATVVGVVVTVGAGFPCPTGTGEPRASKARRRGPLLGCRPAGGAR